jgi:hypothetical protein
MISLLQPSVSSLVVAWQQLPTMENLRLLYSRRYCPPNIPQLKYSAISSQPSLQNSTLKRTGSPSLSCLYLLLTDCVKNTVWNSNFIVACVFVATGTCLQIRCLKPAVFYSPISQSLHSNDCTQYVKFLFKIILFIFFHAAGSNYTAHSTYFYVYCSFSISVIVRCTINIS